MPTKNIIVLDSAPVWYARAASQTVTPRNVGRRCWREAPRCAEPSAARSSIVFDDIIGFAFQRGNGATRGRASQTATPRTQTFEHRGIALSLAPVWYARAMPVLSR